MIFSGDIVARRRCGRQMPPDDRSQAAEELTRSLMGSSPAAEALCRFRFHLDASAEKSRGCLADADALAISARRYRCRATGMTVELPMICVMGKWRRHVMGGVDADSR